MEISVTDQALAFLGALALGGSLGGLYDLFRLFRQRFRLGLLDSVLDLLYWPVSVGALFFYAVAAGNGDVRLYLLSRLRGRSRHLKIPSRVRLRSQAP